MENKENRSGQDKEFQQSRADAPQESASTPTKGRTLPQAVEELLKRLKRVDKQQVQALQNWLSMRYVGSGMLWHLRHNTPEYIAYRRAALRFWRCRGLMPLIYVGDRPVRLIWKCVRDSGYYNLYYGRRGAPYALGRWYCYDQDIPPCACAGPYGAARDWGTPNDYLLAIGAEPRYLYPRTADGRDGVFLVPLGIPLAVYEIEYKGAEELLLNELCSIITPDPLSYVSDIES